MLSATPVPNEHIPKHIAIIMDGNGRWAKSQNKARHQGHRAGAKVVQDILRASYDAGVKVVTLFAFSSENWHRPKKEVSLLMELFLSALDREVRELHSNGVMLKFIGDIDAFDGRIQERMAAAEALTENNQSLRVNIAVGYGGRWDIAQAAKQLAAKAVQQEIMLADITEATLAEHLQINHCPEPDLFIRTGGEQRISNFLLWNLAYTELYFTDTLWPDFDAESLHQAIEWFGQRQRRFGRVDAADVD